MTGEITDAEIAAARRRAASRTDPRAVDAYYDPENGRIVLELDNGALFAFPAELGQGLEGATAEQLADVEVTPSGYGLHWEALDADLGVPELLQGLFGNRAWMRELGRKGGRATSPAKARAARRNGRKGGRPRKRDEAG